MDSNKKPRFIDLFAGCGGLSLGLSNAGWQGVFAIEKTSDAFATFKENFLDGPEAVRFAWPGFWLEEMNHSIEVVLEKHTEEIRSMRGTVDLIAGGPPCQGFSFAGRRNPADPRNLLFEKYVDFVRLLQPKVLVLENVPGMLIAHGVGKNKPSKAQIDPDSYFGSLRRTLHSAGYEISYKVLNASMFGVPQRRERLIVIGLNRDMFEAMNVHGLPDEFFYNRVFEEIFADIHDAGKHTLRGLSSSGEQPVSVEDAISDLRVGGRKVNYTANDSRPGFMMAPYLGPKSKYQKAMHVAGEIDEMDSMRLANHRPDIENRFQEILDLISPEGGGKVPLELTKRLGLRKHRIHVLSPQSPAATLTTLPDDLLHYNEPRILTVREYARLQSFPDWFKFRGKYTTGGELRKKECPRYTQIGNAVPPLLAQAIGEAIIKLLAEADTALARYQGKIRSSGKALLESL